MIFSKEHVQCSMLDGQANEIEFNENACTPNVWVRFYLISFLCFSAKEKKTHPSIKNEYLAKSIGIRQRDIYDKCECKYRAALKSGQAVGQTSVFITDPSVNISFEMSLTLLLLMTSSRTESVGSIVLLLLVRCIS